MAGVGDVDGEGDSRRKEGCSWSSCVVAMVAGVRILRFDRGVGDLPLIVLFQTLTRNQLKVQQSRASKKVIGSAPQQLRNSLQDELSRLLWKVVIPFCFEDRTVRGWRSDIHAG